MKNIDLDFFLIGTHNAEKKFFYLFKVRFLWQITVQIDCFVDKESYYVHIIIRKILYLIQTEYLTI